MKHKIRLIGIEHKTGVKKETNKPYDFYMLHGVYTSDNTEGEATLSCVVPDDEVPSLKIGQTYTVIYHFWQNKIQLDGIV